MQAPPTQTDITALKTSAEALERELRGVRPGPGVTFKMTQLAVTLHQLHTFVPDGGTRYPRARELYEAVIAAENPDSGLHVFALINLAALHLSAGQSEAALATMQRAQRLCTRHHAALQHDASNTVSAMGPDASALKQILEHCHSNDFNLAKLYFSLGDPGKGEDIIRAGLLSQAVLNDAPEVYSKAAATLRRPTEMEVAEFERLALLHDGTPRRGPLVAAGDYEAAWLYFALSQAKRRQSDHEAAWKWLRKANDLQDPVDYDDGKPARDLKVLRDTFLGRARQGDTAWDALVRGDLGSRDATPVFVVGLPRSGSSLVEAILDAHPAAWGAGEDSPLASLMTRVLGPLQSGAWMSSQTTAFKEVGDEYCRLLRQRLPEARQNVTRVVDKMLFNAWSLGFISMILPEAKIVHVSRHPADAILSCYMQPFERRGVAWANSLPRIIEQYRRMRDVMALWRTVLPPGRIIELRYEDLVREPERVSRSLMAALGLDWAPAVLGFHARGRHVATASALQVREPVHGRAVQAWRPFARWMVPVLAGVKSDVLEYEREAGLESSVEIFAEWEECRDDRDEL